MRREIHIYGKSELVPGKILKILIRKKIYKFE